MTPEEKKDLLPEGQETTEEETAQEETPVEIVEDDDFADSHPYVAPEPKAEEEKPQEEPLEEDVEELPDDEPEPEAFNASEHGEFDDPRLEGIETARQAWQKSYKSLNVIRIILSVGTLVLVVGGYLIPFLTIQNQTEKSKWALIVAAICAAVGIAGIAVFGIIQRRKDKAGIHDYFETYYNNLNAYIFEGLPVESLQGGVDNKITPEEANACGLYPNTSQVGSRDSITFTYEDLDCALCDMATQKEEGRGLRTTFVGKYLRMENRFAGNEQGLVIYYKGNERALPPEALPNLNKLSANKRFAIYGCSADKKYLTPKMHELLRKVFTDDFLIDVAIAIKPGRTYICLGYEDTLMVLPNERPFQPGFVKRYREQLKQFLELAKALSGEASKA